MEAVENDDVLVPVVFRCLGLNLGVAVLVTIWTIASVGITTSPSSTLSDRLMGPVFAIVGAWTLVTLLRMEVRISPNGVTLRRVRTRFVPWEQLGDVRVVRGVWFDAIRVHIAKRRRSFWMPVGGLTMGGLLLFRGINADDDSRSMRVARALDEYRQV